MAQPTVINGIITPITKVIYVIIYHEIIPVITEGHLSVAICTPLVAMVLRSQRSQVSVSPRVSPRPEAFQMPKAPRIRHDATGTAQSCGDYFMIYNLSYGNLWES